MIQLPLFSTIQQSDFWQFFHISIIRELKEEELTYYRLQTGGFQSEVDLMLVIDDQQRMSAGFLGLHRAWIAQSNSGINPFALDIARSFINLAIGGQGPAADNFLRLFQDGFVNKYAGERNHPGPSSTSHPELDAFLGKLPEVMRRFPGCDIRLKNAVAENRETLQVIISSRD